MPSIFIRFTGFVPSRPKYYIVVMNVKLSARANRQFNRHNVPAEHVAYVEIADDMTDEDKAEMAAMRKEYREHPENFIGLDELLAQNGMRREDYKPAKIVYNI